MKKNIQFFLLVFWFFSGFLVLFEYLSHTNFVQNIFHISYPDLFLATTLTLTAFLFFSEGKKIIYKYNQIVFLLPLLLLFLSLIIYMRNFSFFLYLEAEDSIIETVQVILLFMSSMLSFWGSRLYKKQKVVSTLLIIASLGFFIIFGEEISWGQRIFNIQTPEEYAALNTQGEITLHNYGPIFGLVYWAYALIGLVGSTAWLSKGYLRKVQNTLIKQIEKLIPNWQYFFYFFAAFLYSFEVHILNPRSGRATGNALWEEPMELLLFIGVTLFLFELVMKKRSNANS